MGRCSTCSARQALGSLLPSKGTQGGIGSSVVGLAGVANYAGDGAEQVHSRQRLQAQPGSQLLPAADLHMRGRVELSAVSMDSYMQMWQQCFDASG